jgi:hypothetical protein
VRRVLGILLIIRAVSPLLVLAILALVAGLVLGDLRAALEPPAAQIQAEVEALRTLASSLQADVETLQRRINTLVETFSDFTFPDAIPDIPDVINFPALNIPDVNVPIPDVPGGVEISTGSFNVAGQTLSYPNGISISTRNFTLAIPDISAFEFPIPALGQFDDVLRSAFQPVQAVLDAVDVVFRDFSDLNESLQKVPQHLTTIADQGAGLVDDMRGVWREWRRTLVIVFVALAALVVIYFVVPFLDDFRRGLRMARGLPVE